MEQDGQGGNKSTHQPTQTHPAEEQEVCRKEGEKEERGETKPQPSQLCRKLYLSKAERVSS